MIRNVIFDWSGTLVDDLPAVLEATNHVLRQVGLPEMTRERFRAEFKLPFTGFYERHTPQVPMAQLEAWFHGRFREVQDSVQELPHARRFLNFCREHKLRTLLLSTMHADHFAVQARKLGLESYFDHPYLGVWDKRQKIHEILTNHALAPDETVFIGDMEHDIETARHGGILSVGVLTGYNGAHQLRGAAPDLLVEHLGELREILVRNQMSLRAAPSSAAAAEGARLPVVTVGAAIFDPAGRVLMIRTHKWSDRWGIPGGKVKFGEPCVDALLRELREETALEVQDVRFVLVQDCIHSQEFYRDEHFVLLNYRCLTTRPETVVLNEEAQEFRWLPFDEAMELPLNQPTRVLLTALPEPNAMNDPRRPDTIVIEELEVFLRVGVPDDERRIPQRLLLTVEMETDFAGAAADDDSRKTIDYSAVARRFTGLGQGREWRLIESLAEEVAGIVLGEFGALRVRVEIRKFILPGTRHVAVRVERAGSNSSAR